MENILAIIGGVGSIGFALTCVVLAIRNGGLKADAKDADTKRKIAEKTLIEKTAEYKDFKQRAQKQIVDLMEEIDELEDQETRVIASIKDPDTRRARRKSRVLRLLSEASNIEGGNDKRRVSDKSSTNSSDDITSPG